MKEDKLMFNRYAIDDAQITMFGGTDITRENKSISGAGKVNKYASGGSTDITYENTECGDTDITRPKTGITDTSNMTVWDLTVAANLRELDGRPLTAGERTALVGRLLNSREPTQKIARFHIAVNAPSAENGDERVMYPLFYLPPYDNGAKHRTLTGALPATHILSSNAYELEIVRLLALYDRENADAEAVVVKTAARLKTTCFGNFCPHGECYDAGAAALRLYNAVSGARATGARLARSLFDARNAKKRSVGCELYLLLAFAGCPDAGQHLPIYYNEAAGRISRAANRAGADAGFSAIAPLILRYADRVIKNNKF